MSDLRKVADKWEAFLGENPQAVSFQLLPDELRALIRLIRSSPGVRPPAVEDGGGRSRTVEQFTCFEVAEVLREHQEAIRRNCNEASSSIYLGDFLNAAEHIRRLISTIAQGHPATSAATVEGSAAAGATELDKQLSDNLNPWVNVKDGLPEDKQEVEVRAAEPLRDYGKKDCRFISATEDSNGWRFKLLEPGPWSDWFACESSMKVLTELVVEWRPKVRESTGGEL